MYACIDRRSATVGPPACFAGLGIHVYVWMYGHIYIYIYIRMYVYIYIRTHIYTYISLSLSISLSLYIYISIYIYIYTSGKHRSDPLAEATLAFVRRGQLSLGALCPSVLHGIQGSGAPAKHRLRSRIGPARSRGHVARANAQAQSCTGKGIGRRGAGSFFQRFLCFDATPCRPTPWLAHFQQAHVPAYVHYGAIRRSTFITCNYSFSLFVICQALLHSFITSCGRW